MSLTPERWQRLDEIYHAALALSPGERDGFLDTACMGDPDLRREAAALVAWDAKAGSFLAEPLVVTGDPFEIDDAPAPPIEPHTIVGNFRIVRHLGRGGMGDVYEAQDLVLDRPVALKLLRPARTTDSAGRDRILQEARAVSALNHPGIVTIHAVAQDPSGRDFIVMEYVEGATLNERLRHGALTLTSALAVMRQTADALEAAHARGLVHGDLKPANILLRSDDRVKLLDFGLARRQVEWAAGRDLAGPAGSHVLGTPSYMSPEQARGDVLDPRSDIFSFGAVLYEVTTGRRPFDRSSQAATIDALLHEEPARFPVPRGGGDILDELRQIILRCLRKDPAERFQSMAEVTHALEAMTPRRSTAGRLRSWMAIGLILVVSVAAVWGVWQSRGTAAEQTLPANAAAARFYLEAVASFDRGDARNARVLLEKVVAAEPTYGLGHSALSLAWRNLGNQTKAREEAQLALQHVEGLSRPERLLVEARYWMTSGQAAKAVEIYRTLFRLYPENLEYGGVLAGLLTSLNQRAEALETIDALRHAQPLAQRDFRVNLLEAGTARNFGDLARAQVAAARAARIAVEEADPRRIALGRQEQGFIASAQGDLDEAREHHTAAAEAFQAAGDQRLQAGVRLSLGNVLWKQGDLSGARNAYERAASLHRELQSPSGERTALETLATMLTATGDLTGAREIYARMDPNSGDMYSTKLLIGTLALHQGDLSTARSLLTAELTAARKFKNKAGEGLALYGLAELAAVQGDLASALRQSDQGLMVLRQVPGGSPGVEAGIAASATILIAQGEFTAARRVLEEFETLAIPLNVGALHRTAAFVSLRATLALEEGRAAEAETLAKRAAELFRRDGYRDAEAAATDLWGRALRASGQPGLADEAIARAQALAALSQDVMLRLTVSIGAAAARANSDALRAADSALSSLEAARREAAAIGYRQLELQAGLAAAEIQMKSGKHSQAVQRLVALERDATKLGLGLIARKASLLHVSGGR